MRRFGCVFCCLIGSFIEGPLASHIIRTRQEAAEAAEKADADGKASHRGGLTTPLLLGSRDEEQGSASDVGVRAVRDTGGRRGSAGEDERFV